MVSENNPIDSTKVDAEIECLIELYLEKSLSQDEADRLLEHVTKIPELATRLYDTTALDDLIRRSFGNSKPTLRQDPNEFLDELVRLAADSPALPMSQREKNTEIVRIKRKQTKAIQPYVPLKKSDGGFRFLQTLVVVAAFSFASYFFYFSQADRSSTNSLASRPVPIAVLTDTARADWNGPAPFQLGEPIHGGRLMLNSGYVELLLYNGNRVVLEGPCDLSLLSSNLLFGKSGKFHASVPSSGIGLEIQTPHTTVRDLGTAFFLNVTPEKSDVQVVDGLVEVIGNEEKPIPLRRGEAMEIDSGRKSHRSATDSSHFVSSEKMRTLSALCPENIKARTQAAQRLALLKPLVQLDGTARQEIVGFGTVETTGCQTVPGRTPSTRSLSFSDKGAHVRLDAKNAFRSLTFATWVRIDKLDSLTFNPLLVGGTTSEGSVLWNISSDGALVFGFRSSRLRQVGNYRTPIVFTQDQLGVWTHLAVTIDAAQRNVTLFFNGNVVAKFPLENDRPIRLRDTLVGNWKPKTTPIHPLNGLLEDFQIYDRALTADEIHQLYYKREQIAPF